MAEEKLKIKWRVAGIDFSDNTDIKDKTTANAAAWVTAPRTLRDDELLITPPTVNKNPIYSHEADAPEENEITIGDPRNITGSFIKMTTAQLVDLVGGKMDGTAYVMEDVLKVLKKAIRIRFQGGGWVVFPRVEGYVLLDMNVGFEGRIKAPFEFTPLASDDGKSGGIWETDTSATAPAAAPLAAPANTGTTK
ncbi:hypothetical protein [Dysgonomonas sp. Marseille-P4361]|uniref:hypothetical protein n=1 Tax=Dysgonomonas sp. Marseille-P4361 TaxID=2161820 RepID=UPI000D5509F8|nr:hypothetical protein [Dysgonomonas sp. Marseille-P4361]